MLKQLLNTERVVSIARMVQVQGFKGRLRREAGGWLRQFSPAYAVLNRRVYRREDAEVHINRSN